MKSFDFRHSAAAHFYRHACVAVHFLAYSLGSTGLEDALIVGGVNFEVGFICMHFRFNNSNFYSAYSSPLLLRSAPATARILCRNLTPKCHRQLRVKDLPKVNTWRLERDSNPRPSGRKASTHSMRHHAPHVYGIIFHDIG